MHWHPPYRGKIQSSYCDSGEREVSKGLWLGPSFHWQHLLVMLLLCLLVFNHFLLTVWHNNCQPEVSCNNNTAGWTRLSPDFLQPTIYIIFWLLFVLNKTQCHHLRIKHRPELPQVGGSPLCQILCSENLGPTDIRAGFSLRTVTTAISDKGHMIVMRRGSLIVVFEGKNY